MSRATIQRIAALLLLTIALPAMAQRYAYIPRSGLGVVSVVDTQTNTVSPSTIAVGTTPWGVAVHPAGHRAYISNFGSDNVSVINTATNTVVATVTVGDAPYHVAVSPDGSEVWVPNFSSGTISIISTATNTVIATITGVPSANAIAFSPVGNVAYVTGYSNSRIYIVNTLTRTATFVAGPANSEALAVHPSGRFVYVTGVGSNTVSVLNTATNAVTTHALGQSGGYGVAVHPNGRFYYVGVGARYIITMRVSDNTVVATLDQGNNRGPTGISLTPSGNFAYVSNRTNGTVAVFNTTTNAIATTITGIGNTPYALGAAIQRPLFGQGSIASGQYHSCRVRGDQTVNCWGRDDFGQATAPAGSFTQVVAGSAHSCGLKTDGTVACWGNNTYGQSTPATGTFQLLSSGARHVCGIRADSSVACWGENDQGQATPATGTNFQGIAAGSSHTCGLRSTGGISCWGRNAEGQSTAPAGSYVQVVTGSAFTCGLTAANAAVCWGDATGGKTSPVAGSYTKLSAQANYACGINFSGAMACWGTDNYGETIVPAIAHADVAAGRSHTCSLQALGVAQCWGWNLYNQAPQFELAPLAVTSGTVGVAFAGTQTFSMLVSNPGSRYPYVPRTPAFAVVSGSLPPGLSLSAAGVLSGTPTLGGSYTFTVQGEDANGFVAERAYTMAVAGAGDVSAPVITATVEGLAGTNGWYRGNVVVSWSVTDAQSQVTSTTGCGPVVVSVETAGQLITCQATSAGGTSSQSVTIKLDKTAPTAVPSVSNVRPLLNEVITASGNGVDALSGIASEVCDAPLTNVISPVQRRINCTVTDGAGNVAVKPASYLVIYGFQGFTDTVLNPGWYNLAGLNQPITFKFRVVDANDVPVTTISAASMASAVVACPTSTKNTAPVSASAPGLVNLGNGDYEFTWVSPAVASCARLNLQLGDGNAINRALFKFQ